jgi:alpha-glucosidase (family GH31 glycosyl hydrolase)
MAGEFILVAPMFSGQTSREVVIPNGKWYDFYSGAYVGEVEVIKITPGLDKIPVFVKDGGIIPLMKTGLHAPIAGQKIDLFIQHYQTKTGSYFLYDDDGETNNYEEGEYSWRELKLTKERME